GRLVAKKGKGRAARTAAHGAASGRAGGAQGETIVYCCRVCRVTREGLDWLVAAFEPRPGTARLSRVPRRTALVRSVPGGWRFLGLGRCCPWAPGQEAVVVKP